MYFTGTVLPGKGVRTADDDDSSFHINHAEANTIVSRLRGLPVKFEHNNDLEIGRIEGALLREDGSMWVRGKLEQGDSLAGNYVSRCLGDGLYTGLSLSHVHREFSDGSTSKEPLEVSLCTEPRRPGCRIHGFADYKDAVRCASAMSETQETAPAPATEPAAAPEPVAAAEPQPDPPSAAETHAMEKALEEHKRAESSAQRAADAEEKLKSLQAKWDAREAAEKKAADEKQKAYLEEMETKKKNLLSAVSDSLGKLQGDTYDADATSNLFNRIEDPALATEVMQLVQCASSRAVDAQRVAKESAASAERAALQHRYDLMMQKSAGVVSAPAPAAAAPVDDAPAAKRARVVSASSNPYATAPKPRAASSQDYTMQAANDIRAAFQGISGGRATDAMRHVLNAAKAPTTKSFLDI